MIPIYWFAIHLILIPISIVRIRSNIYSAILYSIGISCIYLYFLKDITYDLNWYYNYFISPHDGYEYLFFQITNIMRNELKLNEYFIHFAFTIFTAFFFTYSFRKIVSTHQNRILAFVLSFSTLFVLLSTQNVIRQGISLSLISILLLDKEIRPIKFTTVGLIATLFHWSAPLFCALLLASKLIAFKVPRRYQIPFSLLCGITMSLLLSLAYSGTGVEVVYLEISRFEEGRQDSTVKYIYYFTFWVISHFLATRNNTEDNDNYSRLLDIRKIVIISILPLAFYPEAFSRIAYFYLLVDSMVCITSILSDKIKRRQAGAVILFSYGIAINALNILSGGQFIFDTF